MEHDLRLRAAARAIFDACYPSDDWSRSGSTRLSGSERSTIARLWAPLNKLAPSLPARANNWRCPFSPKIMGGWRSQDTCRPLPGRGPGPCHLSRLQGHRGLGARRADQRGAAERRKHRMACRAIGDQMPSSLCGPVDRPPAYAIGQAAGATARASSCADQSFTADSARGREALFA